MYDESEFVKDNGKEPIRRRFSDTYFVRHAKGPDVGSEVRIKSGVSFES